MKKILLIVLDDVQREALRRLLMKQSLNVTSAASFTDGEAMIRTFAPDSVVIDAALVEKYVPDLVRRFPSLPFVAWMSRRDARLAVSLLRSGVRECLHPPVERQEVLAVLRYVLPKFSEPKRERRGAGQSMVWHLLRTAAVAATVAVVGVAAFRIARPRSPATAVTYALGYNNPIGILRDGDNVWTVDWYTQSVYQYRAGTQLQLVNAYSFPSFNPGTLTELNGQLMVAGSDGYARLYRASDRELVLVAKVKLPQASVSGLCVQGNFLWTVDAETRRICQQPVADMERVIATFPYPGEMPVGIFWDGSSFWSADGKENRIYRHYGPEEQFRIAESFSVAPPDGGSLAGLSGDKTSLWLIFNGPAAKIMRYPRKALRFS